MCVCVSGDEASASIRCRRLGWQKQVPQRSGEVFGKPCSPHPFSPRQFGAERRVRRRHAYDFGLSSCAGQSWMRWGPRLRCASAAAGVSSDLARWEGWRKILADTSDATRQKAPSCKRCSPLSALCTLNLVQLGTARRSARQMKAATAWHRGGSESRRYSRRGGAVRGAICFRLRTNCTARVSAQRRRSAALAPQCNLQRAR
jgi:hypothetical protein